MDEIEARKKWNELFDTDVQFIRIEPDRGWFCPTKKVDITNKGEDTILILFLSENDISEYRQ
jgi:hypothetical protein